MCGIAGLLRLDGGNVDRDLLSRITTLIAHRGPDGEGFFRDGPVGLGHRRLSIIDVAGGAQPMFNEDRSAAIVFNGEIYNFPTLRAELQSLGHVFANRCDTEAIVHAWESFGPDCLERLDGMFAFALWDARSRRLFLARDRLGKKPLYYTLTPHHLGFASELRALAALPGIDRRIDPAAVDDFLALGYVPDPATIFRGVAKLPPGHFLSLDVDALLAGRALPDPVRYWRPRVSALRIGAAEAAETLRDKLLAATGARLLADVPLGAFLSGGVDSSGVVAAAAQLRAAAGEPGLDTFTIAFAGSEDETPYAAQVAARWHTVQHNQTAAAIDWVEAARQVGRMFGEPFGDSSAVPTAEVCRLARGHATVALSGDGGDEAFAGYRRHRWHLLVEGARGLIPRGMRRRLVGQLASVYPKLDRAPRWLRAKHTLTELSLDSAFGYYRTMARVQHDRRRALFSPAQEEAVDGHDPAARIAVLMAESGTDDPLAQAQYADLSTWLAGQMLVKVDRASMAHGLEVRSPLLDHRLVEWGLSLPAPLKLAGGQGKRVLKQALEPWLPRELLHRPKQGFATSLSGPLRSGIATVRRRLLGAAMGDSGLFDLAALGQLVDEHESGRFDHAQALWHLLVFEGFLVSELDAASVGEAALV